MPKPMRAKMTVQSVEKFPEMNQERVSFSCVTTKTYDETGLDEDNTFARFSPAGGAHVTIANPALLGVYEPGQTFYVDFTPVPPVD